MSFQQFNINNSLTSVDVVQTENLIGIYNNGQINNGVGSTLQLNTTSLVIDSVNIVIGMYILLIGQTNQNENGIYIFSGNDEITGNIIFTRRDDFHCIEQLNGGQYLSVSNGINNAGSIFVLTDPLPERFGIDPIIIVNTVSSNDFNINLATATPGVVNALNATITDTVAVNEPGSSLIPLQGTLRLKGVTFCDHMTAVNGTVISLGGNYLVDGLRIAGITADIDFTISGSNVNKADIYGVLARFRGFDGSTDLSNVKGVGSMVQNTTDIINSHFYAFNRAQYAFQFAGVNSDYKIAAGTSPGSAGDPTKCNATNVLKVLFGTAPGTPAYIPIFFQNT